MKEIWNGNLAEHETSTDISRSVSKKSEGNIISNFHFVNRLFVKVTPKIVAIYAETAVCDKKLSFHKRRT